jgi:hypothetical protein
LPRLPLLSGIIASPPEVGTGPTTVIVVGLFNFAAGSPSLSLDDFDLV